MNEEGKKFIDFLLEAGKRARLGDYQLIKEFAKANTPEELRKFFSEKGFRNIDEDDIPKIMEAKKEFDLTDWPPPPAY